jgi:ribosome-associated toxin RatA of RatAB toxin-antitoxin module
MASDSVERVIPVSTEATWALVGDFNAFDKFSPALEAYRIDDNGDRVLTVFGNEIRERFTSRDDSARSITYSIIEGLPVTSHVATITVHDDPAGSRVTWDVTVEPEEMLGLFSAIYTGSLGDLETALLA